MQKENSATNDLPFLGEALHALVDLLLDVVDLLNDFFLGLVIVY